MPILRMCSGVVLKHLSASKSLASNSLLDFLLQFYGGQVQSQTRCKSYGRTTSSELEESKSYHTLSNKNKQKDRFKHKAPSWSSAECRRKKSHYQDALKHYLHSQALSKHVTKRKIVSKKGLKTQAHGKNSKPISSPDSSLDVQVSIFKGSRVGSNKNNLNQNQEDSVLETVLNLRNNKKIQHDPSTSNEINLTPSEKSTNSSWSDFFRLSRSKINQEDFENTQEDAVLATVLNLRKQIISKTKPSTSGEDQSPHVVTDLSSKDSPQGLSSKALDMKSHANVDYKHLKENEDDRVLETALNLNNKKTLEERLPQKPTTINPVMKSSEGNFDNSTSNSFPQKHFWNNVFNGGLGSNILSTDENNQEKMDGNKKKTTAEEKATQETITNYLTTRLSYEENSIPSEDTLPKQFNLYENLGGSQIKTNEKEFQINQEDSVANLELNLQNKETFEHDQLTSNVELATEEARPMFEIEQRPKEKTLFDYIKKYEKKPNLIETTTPDGHDQSLHAASNNKENDNHRGIASKLKYGKTTGKNNNIGTVREMSAKVIPLKNENSWIDDLIVLIFGGTNSSSVQKSKSITLKDDVRINSLVQPKKVTTTKDPNIQPAGNSRRSFSTIGGNNITKCDNSLMVEELQKYIAGTKSKKRAIIKPSLKVHYRPLISKERNVLKGIGSMKNPCGVENQFVNLSSVRSFQTSTTIKGFDDSKSKKDQKKTQKGVNARAVAKTVADYSKKSYLKYRKAKAKIVEINNWIREVSAKTSKSETETQASSKYSELVKRTDQKEEKTVESRSFDREGLLKVLRELKQQNSKEHDPKKKYPETVEMIMKSKDSGDDKSGSNREKNDQNTIAVHSKEPLGDLEKKPGLPSTKRSDDSLIPAFLKYEPKPTVDEDSAKNTKHVENLLKNPKSKKSNRIDVQTNPKANKNIPAKEESLGLYKKVIEDAQVKSDLQTKNKIEPNNKTQNVLSNKQNQSEVKQMDQIAKFLHDIKSLGIEKELKKHDEDFRLLLSKKIVDDEEKQPRKSFTTYIKKYVEYIIPPDQKKTTNEKKHICATKKDVKQQQPKPLLDVFEPLNEIDDIKKYFMEVQEAFRLLLSKKIVDDETKTSKVFSDSVGSKKTKTNANKLGEEENLTSNISIQNVVDIIDTTLGEVKKPNNESDLRKTIRAKPSQNELEKHELKQLKSNQPQVKEAKISLDEGFSVSIDVSKKVIRNDFRVLLGKKILDEAEDVLAEHEIKSNIFVLDDIIERSFLTPGADTEDTIKSDVTYDHNNGSIRLICTKDFEMLSFEMLTQTVRDIVDDLIKQNSSQVTKPGDDGNKGGPKPRPPGRQSGNMVQGSVQQQHSPTKENSKSDTKPDKMDFQKLSTKDKAIPQILSNETIKNNAKIVHLIKVNIIRFMIIKAMQDATLGRCIKTMKDRRALKNNENCLLSFNNYQQDTLWNNSSFKVYSMNIGANLLNHFMLMRYILKPRILPITKDRKKKNTRSYSTDDSGNQFDLSDSSIKSISKKSKLRKSKSSKMIMHNRKSNNLSKPFHKYLVTSFLKTHGMYDAVVPPEGTRNMSDHEYNQKETEEKCSKTGDGNTLQVSSIQSEYDHEYLSEEEWTNRIAPSSGLCSKMNESDDQKQFSKRFNNNVDSAEVNSVLELKPSTKDFIIVDDNPGAQHKSKDCRNNVILLGSGKDNDDQRRSPKRFKDNIDSGEANSVLELKPSTKDFVIVDDNPRAQHKSKDCRNNVILLGSGKENDDQKIYPKRFEDNIDSGEANSVLELKPSTKDFVIMGDNPRAQHKSKDCRNNVILLGSGKENDDQKRYPKRFKDNIDSGEANSVLELKPSTKDFVIVGDNSEAQHKSEGCSNNVILFSSGNPVDHIIQNNMRKGDYEELSNPDLSNVFDGATSKRGAYLNKISGDENEKIGCISNGLNKDVQLMLVSQGNIKEVNGQSISPSNVDCDFLPEYKNNIPSDWYNQLIRGFIQTEIGEKACKARTCLNQNGLDKRKKKIAVEQVPIKHKNNTYYRKDENKLLLITNKLNKTGGVVDLSDSVGKIVKNNETDSFKEQVQTPTILTTKLNKEGTSIKDSVPEVVGNPKKRLDVYHDTVNEKERIAPEDIKQRAKSVHKYLQTMKNTAFNKVHELSDYFIIAKNNQKWKKSVKKIGYKINRSTNTKTQKSKSLAHLNKNLVFKERTKSGQTVHRYFSLKFAKKNKSKEGSGSGSSSKSKNEKVNDSFLKDKIKLSLKDGEKQNVKSDRTALELTEENRKTGVEKLENDNEIFISGEADSENRRLSGDKLVQSASKLPEIEKRKALNFETGQNEDTDIKKIDNQTYLKNDFSRIKEPSLLHTDKLTPKLTNASFKCKNVLLDKEEKLHVQDVAHNKNHEQQQESKNKTELDDMFASFLFKNNSSVSETQEKTEEDTEMYEDDNTLAEELSLSDDVETPQRFEDNAKKEEAEKSKKLNLPMVIKPDSILNSVKNKLYTKNIMRLPGFSDILQLKSCDVANPFKNSTTVNDEYERLSNLVRAKVDYSNDSVCNHLYSGQSLLQFLDKMQRCGMYKRFLEVSAMASEAYARQGVNDLYPTNLNLICKSLQSAVFQKFYERLNYLKANNYYDPSSYIKDISVTTSSTDIQNCNHFYNNCFAALKILHNSYNGLWEFATIPQTDHQYYRNPYTHHRVSGYMSKDIRHHNEVTPKTDYDTLSELNDVSQRLKYANDYDEDDQIITTYFDCVSECSDQINDTSDCSDYYSLEAEAILPPPKLHKIGEKIQSKKKKTKTKFSHSKKVISSKELAEEKISIKRKERDHETMSKTAKKSKTKSRRNMKEQVTVPLEDFQIQMNLNIGSERQKKDIVRKTLTAMTLRLTEIASPSMNTGDQLQKELGDPKLLRDTQNDQFIDQISQVSVIKTLDDGQTTKTKTSKEKPLRVKHGINVGTFITSDGNVAYKLESCKPKDQRGNVYNVFELCAKEIERKEKLMSLISLQPSTLLCCGINPTPKWEPHNRD